LTLFFQFFNAARRVTFGFIFFMMKSLLAGIFWIVLVVLGYGQKSLSEAQRLFSVKAFEEAIPLFEKAFEEGATDPLAFYQAGYCYSRLPDLNLQLKGIPFYEKAIATGKNLPPAAYFEAAQLHLKNEDLANAQKLAGQHKNLTAADKKAQADATKLIDVIQRAAAFMSVPRNFTVASFPGSVNTRFTEYNPVVSADESVMAFTALRPNTGKTRSADKFIEEIYISYNQTGSWSEPKVIPLASDYNVGTAGISADGQKMLVFMGGINDPGNLFQIAKTGDTWSKPTLINPLINSPQLESTASISPDGKTIYFASDRRGTLGGMDIWKMEQRPDGSWAAPVNLGAPINTKDNEDAPFIHPDQKTLFFTSDGHATMGGRDIFVSRFEGGKWSKPENMGYPVNTTANDNYFTLLADGRRAYFSSDRKGGKGAQDIYYLDMPADASSIPLTMIKGKILNAETGKPIPTRMYVVDNTSKKKVDFVYDPDPQTGQYLIILPPAKNYDIIIESEGFLPYTLNVNVPNQDYFYELYQQVSLKTIRQFDVVVGQEVLVKNAFYDTHQDSKTDLRKTHEAKLVQGGSVDVYDMMLDLMASNDKEGIAYLVDLINMKDPVDAINFDEKSNSKIEVATRTYFYDESDESKFERKQVEGKEIFTLPTMFVAEEARRLKETKKPAVYNRALLGKTAKVFFDAGRSDIKAQYTTELETILKSLTEFPDLGIEISGFASAEGSEELNRELSNKRAIAVLEYFNHKGIVRRRIVARGYGAAKDQAATKEEGRRVEVKVVDLQATPR
jgi:outer membrane protein OmpA-like peptidoglycan-associated protein